MKFPQKKEIQNNTDIISSHPLTNPPIIQAPVIQAWNENHKSCLQIGPGIISANDISYLNWERFSDDIKILLNSYFDCASPSMAQRTSDNGTKSFKAFAHIHRVLAQKQACISWNGQHFLSTSKHVFRIAGSKFSLRWMLNPRYSRTIPATDLLFSSTASVKAERLRVGVGNNLFCQ